MLNPFNIPTQAASATTPGSRAAGLRAGRRGDLPPSAAEDLGATPQPTPGTPTSPSAVGVFITGQSLTTFPVASMVVSLVWNVLGNIFPDWGTKKVVALIIALIVGAIIYLLSLNKGESAKAILTGVLIAILNSFTLAAAALGISASGLTKAAGGGP